MFCWEVGRLRRRGGLFVIFYIFIFGEGDRFIYFLVDRLVKDGRRESLGLFWIYF